MLNLFKMLPFPVETDQLTEEVFYEEDVFRFMLLILVGAVGAVSTSSVMSAQSDQRAGLATISGKVKDVKGAGVKGQP